MYNIDYNIPLDQIHWAWTAAIPLITAGISGLAGLFGGQPKTKTTTSDTTQNSSGSFNQSGSTNPILNTNANDLMNYFTNDAVNRYNKGPVDLSGYTAGGLQQINEAGDLKQKILQNMLASKGQQFSPASVYPQQQQQSDRINQSTQFMETIPLLQKQFQDQNFQNLLSSFGAIPKGSATDASGTSTQTGTSSTKGTSTDPGNSTGGLFSGIGSILPFLNFGGNKKSSNDTGFWGNLGMD